MSCSATSRSATSSSAASRSAACRSAASRSVWWPAVIGTLTAVLAFAAAQSPPDTTATGLPSGHAGGAHGAADTTPRTPPAGLHLEVGDWMLMIHGSASLDYTESSEPRGGRELFGTNMMGFSLQRAAGPGTLRLGVMGSMEPLNGPSGYPLLLQTGESADGAVPLVDRQHPHDALMELSGRYSAPVTPDLDLFAYVAAVGEPALGPTVFLHRPSGRDLSTAPIGHHFFDATHIAHGVVTVGIATARGLTIEGSLFNGREPDHRRWSVDPLRLDSYSARVTVRPNERFSVQGSVGALRSPERLHPGIDVTRLTLTATHAGRLGPAAWHTTVGLGRNKRARTLISVSEARRSFPPALLAHYLSLIEATGVAEDELALLFPARVQIALLLETSVRWGPSTLVVRLERAEKDELFPASDVRHSRVFPVSKLTAGYVHDLLTTGSMRLGVGASGSLHVLPGEVRAAYGGAPRSLVLFTRILLE